MRKKIIFSLIILSLIFTIGQASYAAVEIVPSKNGKGTDAIVDTTVSNSYLLCQGMKNTGESLKGTSVKPHLATNKDWGAVSYLSNSIYGTNTQGGNNGKEVTINNVKYYSTTTNITGVMNWGSNPNKGLLTQTSALIKAYKDLEETTTASAHNNVIELETATNNNSKYVEVINTGNRVFNEKTDGMALSEINNYSFVGWKHVFNNTDYPISIRNGLFGFLVSYTVSSYTYTNASAGVALSNVTFRPVVWN